MRRPRRGQQTSALNESAQRYWNRPRSSWFRTRTRRTAVIGYAFPNSLERCFPGCSTDESKLYVNRVRYHSFEGVCALGRLDMPFEAMGQLRNCAYAVTYATVRPKKCSRSLPALEFPKISGSLLKILLHFGRDVSRIDVIRRLGVIHFSWLCLSPVGVSTLLET